MKYFIKEVFIIIIIRGLSLKEGSLKVLDFLC